MYKLEKPIPENSRKKNSFGPLAGLLAAIGAVLLKFKVGLLALLKALPLLKLGWILQSFGSMFLSLLVYSLAFGWRYAITIVGLIYVHELGHYFLMKVKGLNPRAPVFVPFLGAYTAMSNLPGDPVTHAMVAYAGPLVGGLAAWAMYYLGMQTHSLYLVAAANTGFFLNLFQLLPVRPFDGGFLAGCISRWLCIPGALAVLFLALHFHSPILIVIAVFVLFKVATQFATMQEADIAMSSRILVTLLYFGLAGALAWTYMVSAHELRAFVR